MIVTLGFLAILMATFIGFLLSRSVSVQPWVAEPAGQEPARAEGSGVTAGRVGLAAFLAVATSVFMLCISAYRMRMEMGSGWQALGEPGLLWANTAVLVGASIALQLAWNAARAGRLAALRPLLIVGALASAVFVAGQYVVWRQLVADGHYMSTNPANAFFYLLTAVHAVHLIGGLGALAGTIVRLPAARDTESVRASVELCAIYWHFLLLVWAVLFVLLLRT
jgi:cytochrome c oxidase subunit 3